MAICLATQSCFAGKNATFGDPDCGRWVEEKTAPRKAWLLGYLSGLNLSGIEKGDPLDKLASAEQAFAWMDNYCRQHPLNLLSEGGNALFAELIRKAQK
jgi:hypothetical protein